MDYDKLEHQKVWAKPRNKNGMGRKADTSSRTKYTQEME